MGLEQDYYEGARWFRLAANQGIARAQYSLGRCYFAGDGLVQGFEEAARWLRLGADQDHAIGQVMLGKMLVGDGPGYARVPADIPAGAKLLARAAQCTDPRFARERIEALAALLRHADKREVV